MKLFHFIGSSHFSESLFTGFSSHLSGILYVFSGGSPFSLISDMWEGPHGRVLGPLLYLHHLSKEIILSYGLSQQICHDTQIHLFNPYLTPELQTRYLTSYLSSSSSSLIGSSNIKLIFFYPPNCFLPQTSLILDNGISPQSRAQALIFLFYSINDSGGLIVNIYLKSIHLIPSSLQSC